MSDKFEEVKQKVLLSQYLQGTFKLQGGGKRLRYNNCPFCNGKDCADIIQKYNNEYYYRIFVCNNRLGFYRWL